MEKKKSLFASLIKPMTMLLVLILLLSVTSYAWIRRNWQPTIEQAGITVSTGGSLAFKLSENGSPMTDAKLNEILSEYSKFALKPVSNLTGANTDFFNIRRDDAAGGMVFSKIVAQSDAALSYGYVDITLILVSNEADEEKENMGAFTRYVYIDAEKSVIEDAYEYDSSVSAAKAIRTSITTTQSSGGSVTTNTYLLWNRKENDPLAEPEELNWHRAVTNEHTGDDPEHPVYVADGKLVPTPQTTFDESVHAYNKNIKPLDYYCGFKRNEDGSIDKETKDTTRCLFSIPSGGSISVSLRIWLEGEDPNCTDALAARELNFKLVLDSYLVEASL